MIINEFLTFVQNKIDTLDELSIIQICVTSFTDAEIETGKSVLYSACGGPQRNIQRKGDDKNKKNIKDVIKLLKEIDPDLQPAFVAKDLNRLPPVSFDYVDASRLLKDMTVMRSEFMEFRTKISTELAELRTTLDARKYKENSTMTTPKRQVVKSPLPAAALRQTRNSTRASPPAVDASGVLYTPTYRDIICTTKSVRPRCDKNNRMTTSIRTPNKVTMNDKHACATKVTDTKLTTTLADDSFILVEHKKRKQKRANMRGTLQTSGKIQVVEPQCAIYISRTKKDVTEADIREHIMERGEQCISVEQLKQNRETAFNSFKINVLGSKLKTFLNNDFWPAGLVYRRYRERHPRAAANQINNG